MKSATDAYKAYLAMSEEITADGGSNPERIESFVTPELLQGNLDGFEDLRDQGVLTVGNSAIDSVRLQQIDSSSLSVSVYLCVDLKGLRLVNSEGVDVTPPDRPDRVPLVATFARDQSQQDHLLLSGNDPWSGDNYC